MKLPQTRNALYSEGLVGSRSPLPGGVFDYNVCNIVYKGLNGVLKTTTI